MKISYGITVCNELEEIKKLVKFLHEHKQKEDEICVLLDRPKASQALIDQLHRWSSANWILLRESTFGGHFADWKNELTKMCSGDYIVNIDADELPTQIFVENIATVLEGNDIDMIMVPRVNTVEGLTDQHIQKWGWRVNDQGWINWPDAQQRIYKNTDSIKWVNKVHEVLQGYRTATNLPISEEWAFKHPKTIKKQEEQNKYYATL